MNSDPDQAESRFPYVVRDVLSHLYDLGYLQTHPLARMLEKWEPGGRHGIAGQNLRQILLDTIAVMRPGPSAPADSRAFRSYQVLNLRYVEGLEARAVCKQLAIGTSEYYRERRRAFDAVVSLLQERWGIREARSQPTTVRGEAHYQHAQFPVASDRPHASLPTVPGVFVGREKELAELRKLLDEHRLLTLTGPPGTGKTRLALEAARQMADAFEGGVYFVALAPVTDPDRVGSSMERALGIRGRGSRSSIRRIRATLPEKSVLLLLDNFEQVLAAAPLVAELLDACPNLRVLVTSRARLRVTVEHELPVQPLGVPAMRSLSSAAAMEHAAVALFAARAAEAKPGFVLTDENTSSVVELCTRLDGLPLAIELAAARVRYVPPAQMLALLPSRLALSASGPRDRPVRQQTLREAIAWSYDLLDEPAKRLLRNLAVFDGGWTLEAAEAVVGSRSSERLGDEHAGIDLFESVIAFVEGSLVREDAENGGTSRFSMLETIREYGLERLVGSGEEQTVRGRHAAYYAALAELDRPLATASLHLVEREYDNMRAALDWLVEHGEAEAALRLALTLNGYWLVRGSYAEAQSRLAAALALPSEREVSNERATALRRRGAAALHMGDCALAHACLNEALEIFQQRDDRIGVGSVLHQLMRVTSMEGKNAEARALGEESVRILRATGDRYGLATALMRLARVIRSEEEPATAQRLLNEAVGLLSGSGRVRTLAQVLCVLGEVASDQGQYADARRHFAESLALLHEVADQSVIAQVLEGFAALAAAEEQPERALQLAGAADALRSRLAAPLPPLWRQELDERLRHAAESIGEQQRTAVLASGRAMLSDRAVALALEPAQAPRDHLPREIGRAPGGQRVTMQTSARRRAIRVARRGRAG